MRLEEVNKDFIFMNSKVLHLGELGSIKVKFPHIILDCHLKNVLIYDIY